MRHEGESSSSDSLERSDENDEDDDGTGAKDNNCYGDGDGVGDRNTGAGKGSVEWLGFLSLRALTEVLGDLAKAKAPSLTKSRKKTEIGEKVRIT